MKGPRGRKGKTVGGARAVMYTSKGFVEVDEHGNDKHGVSRGPIPLINAAERGLAPVVKALLARGDTVSLTDADGYTALHAAAYHGHAATTRMLAKAGSHLLDTASLEGDTPLHLATNTGQTEAMEVLIEEGASVDSRNPGGATPLYVAAMAGHLGAVKTLLCAKANPLLTWSNSSGKTFVPLDVAVQTGRSEVVRELLGQLGIGGCGGSSGGLDALRQAVVFGQTHLIAMLMDAGVVDSTGHALLEAIGNGQEAAVGCLLQQQKERQAARQASYVNNARNDLGATALLCSFMDGGGKLCNPRITRRLVDAGADTSSVVQLRVERLLVYVNVTPLEYLKEQMPRKGGDGPATDEHLHRLEAIRRLLLQAEAVHAVSWLWPDNVPLPARPAKSTRTAKHSPTPLTTMLPVLRRRARRRGLLSETLFRYSKET